MSDSNSTVHNLLVGSRDLSTVIWRDKAKRSDKTFWGATVADLGAGPRAMGIDFPTESHRADARVTSGAEYVLSFFARADVAGDRIHSEVWGSLYTLDAELTTGWRLVTMPYGIRKADNRNVYFWGLATNSGTVHVALPMCVRGDTPAAWAPAEGETLPGWGALMSANLLAGVEPTPMSGTTEDGGVWHCPAKDGRYDRIAWNFSGMSALTANQTVHLGLSVKGASANASDLHMVIAYKDAAGNRNWAWSDAMPVGTEWSRSEATVVVPSGMTMTALTVSTNSSAKLPEVWLTSPTLSLGSPVCLASSAHTPYATQDHVSVTYATKSQLKVTDDSIKAEVSARAQTDQNVADLSSRLTQTANSLTMEINSKVTKVQTDVDSNADDVKDLNSRLSDEIRTRKSFMRFSEESSDPTLTLGQTNSPAQVKLTNKQLQFLYLNTVVAYMSGDALLINNAKILQQLQLGGFAFVPRDNGNLAFKWVGGDS